jgi:hypothetical protein
MTLDVTLVGGPVVDGSGVPAPSTSTPIGIPRAAPSGGPGRSVSMGGAPATPVC